MGVMGGVYVVRARWGLMVGLKEAGVERMMAGRDGFNSVDGVVGWGDNWVKNLVLI